MKSYEIAVFDVDGTLLDTSRGVLASVEFTIKKADLSPLPVEIMRTFIGPPIQNSFAKYYGLDKDETQKLAEIFREVYKNQFLLEAVPYEGIYEALETLQNKGIKLAVATYKRQDYAVDILKHFNFHKYTNILYGADNQNKLKKQDIIQKCMDDLNVKDYQNAVMIGDSDNDAVGAAALGMKFIGVTYGFDFSADADVKRFPNIGVAHTPLEIIKLFE